MKSRKRSLSLEQRALCNPTKTPMEAQLMLNKEERRRVDTMFYRRLIGSLRYLFYTRPDLTFLVSILSIYMVNPTSDYWTPSKRGLRHLKGVIDFGLIFEKGVRNLKVIGYNNSDFIGDVEDRKIIT